MSDFEDPIWGHMQEIRKKIITTPQDVERSNPIKYYLALIFCISFFLWTGFKLSYIFPFEEKVKSKEENLNPKVEELNTSVKEEMSSLHPEIKLTIGQKVAIVGTQEKMLDTPPCIIAGRTLLPLRFIGEVLGANFIWDNQQKKVTYILGSNTVEHVVGQKNAQVNGQTVPLDVPAHIIDGRTMLPLRFIGESLGTSVTWGGETKTVVLR